MRCKFFKTIVIDNILTYGASYDVVGDAHIGIVSLLTNQSVRCVRNSEIKSFVFNYNQILSVSGFGLLPNQQAFGVQPNAMLVLS